jgi:hypothetical protein
MDVREVIDHHGDIIVRARYDRTYNKTNLPDELIMTIYFSVRDGKIVSLTIIFTQPSLYCLAAHNRAARPDTFGCGQGPMSLPRQIVRL